MSNDVAEKRSTTPFTSEDWTNRITASGSMKRLISHGQARRSILGRARVTQMVRPFGSRFGSLAVRTSADQWKAARHPSLKAPFEVLGGDTFIAEPCGDSFAVFCFLLVTDDGLLAGEVGSPGRDSGEVTPNRARDQTRVSGEILVVANIDDRGPAGEPDEARKLGSIDLRMRWHARPLRRKVDGRDL